MSPDEQALVFTNKGFCWLRVLFFRYRKFQKQAAAFPCSLNCSTDRGTGEIADPVSFSRQEIILVSVLKRDKSNYMSQDKNLNVTLETNFQECVQQS